LLALLLDYDVKEVALPLLWTPKQAKPKTNQNQA
jgi:hypothetical protein